MPRFIDANAKGQVRCSYDITLRDGSKAQCGRRAIGGAGSEGLAKYCTQHARIAAGTADRFSFRVPKDAFAMRKDVAEGIKAAEQLGVKEIIDDPYLANCVYIRCNRATWIRLQLLGVRYVGNQRRGDLRRRLFSPTEDSSR